MIESAPFIQMHDFIEIPLHRWLVFSLTQCRIEDPYVLELDFGPFNANFPRLTRPSSIGNGVQFLNRHLCSRLFGDVESMLPLFEFLRTHKYQGQVNIHFAINNTEKSLKLLFWFV